LVHIPDLGRKSYKGRVRRIASCMRSLTAVTQRVIQWASYLQ